MDAASSSSKVTVEYHDPSGVFPLVSRSIADRLPLRNLNWQSPSRPLRQIRQLHVEFVADRYTQTNLRPPIQRFDSTGPSSSFDIVRGGKDDRKDAPKQRRHQIPGLKTSPYLKIYVLRCDDKDTYKETERKRIRDWIKENAQTEGRRGEEHDAFEWMILHVVVPDTVAASEPRWRESTREPDELKERKTNNIKIPGKSKGTVFDRLRADFNESSKTGQDRVSQIRLQKSDVSPDLLPTPAVATTLEETPQERELAWKDLMDKFKVMLLGPFDTRVRKYEADIAEQEARRSLPGWNFCTFFIHKEGLAKALESIGLVEDALAIYDELLFGLETAVRELASGQADGTATRFAAFTDDIEARILGKSEVNGSHDEGKVHVDLSSSRLFDKDYREKIVRSDISVFDFFSYMFSRQQALILRLANTHAARAEMGASSLKEGGEDLVLMSEVCWRASTFIHNNARTLRQDLIARRDGTGESILPRDMDSQICSWMYAVAEYVLAETSAPVLALTQADAKPVANGSPFKPKRSEFDFATGANPYPQRQSSLITIRKSAPELQRPASVIAESVVSPPASAGKEVAGGQAADIPGLPELANYRAELVMMQRKVLEQLAETRGWRAGWSALKAESQDVVEEVDLDDDHEAEEETEAVVAAEKEGDNSAVSSAMLSSTLDLQLHTEQTFQTAFERLCDQAMRYYALATQTKSVDAIVSDLAMLKRQQGDLAGADTFLKHLLLDHETSGWNDTEQRLLTVYADVLRQLGSMEVYLKTMLKCLGKMAGVRLASKHPIMLDFSVSSFGSGSGVDISMQRAIEASSDLDKEQALSVDDYFMDLRLERDIIHLEEKDGFALRLHFRSVLDEEFAIDEISLRLVGIKDPKQDITLVNGRPVRIRHGLMKVDLLSDTTCLGAFSADRLTFRAGKLCFTHEFMRKREPALQINGEDVLATPRPASDDMVPLVFVYPAQQAFDCLVTLAKNIYLDKPRHILLTLSSGWNEIQGITVKVKPTSAGLRLHLANAIFEDTSRDESVEQKSGHISLSGLARDETAVVKIPYTCENAIADISIRLEVRYETAQGSFCLLDHVTRQHELPLDVDVDDNFRLDTLFSRFTVRTAHTAPIVVTNSTLEDSSVYAVTPLASSDILTVHSASPASLLYKITPKNAEKKQMSKHDAALSLSLRYISTEELLTEMMRERLALSLRDSDYGAFSRLLLPLMTQRCKDCLSSMDLFMAVALNQVKMPAFEDIAWHEVLVVLPSMVRDQLDGWLRAWHKQDTSLPIDYKSPMAERLQRCITLSVEVPTLDMVFGATMSLDVDPAAGNTHTSIAKIGKPINAELRLRHSNGWSAVRLLGQKIRGTAALQSFIVDIQADPDNWLLGGPRRVHFTPKDDDEPTVLKLMLIPIAVGKHSLPIVDLLPDLGSNEDGSARFAGADAVMCETNYESSGMIVEVIRDVRTTKVVVMDGTVELKQDASTGEAAGDHG
ncbi:hypothetical protein LTR86_000712 [Recurvomyces mirabilis]|nr:hypothetical protein LTR86_000712 [Recurvomyces mirabilis]